MVVYGVDDDEGFDKKKLSLYIVLPLMMFCYLGSCIAYCSSKCYKYCKKEKRKKMLLENTEYEPHNKPPQPVPGPRPPPRRPLSASRRVAPMPIHAVPYPVPRQPHPPPRPIRTPVQELKPSTSGSPPQTSRPTTSGAIALDVSATSPPPPYYESKGKGKEKASKVKEEQHRRLLLENALREARGRREKEKTLLGGEMETSLSNKEAPKGRKNKYELSDSSGTSPEPMENMEMDDDNRSRRKRRNKKLRQDDPDSGDSTTDLLAESREPPKGPTMMSIADILKNKMMMNQGRSKPKKRVIQAV